MKKKSFVLIGISIILQYVPIMIPFIGIGKEGIENVNLPITILVSLLLIFISTKNLYKENNNYLFYSAKIMSLVGMIILCVCTIVSPFIIGGKYIGTFEFFKLSTKNFGNNEMLSYMIQFIKSYSVYFLVCSLGVFFYSFSLVTFAKGIKKENVDEVHGLKLIKATKRFSISNTLLVIITTIVLSLFAVLFEKFLPYTESSINLPEEMLGVLVGFYLLFLFIILPGYIVTTIFYYVNFIKSLIYIFKTTKYIK